MRRDTGSLATSILDIDLDYFCLSSDPGEELDRLLAWASRAVDVVVERHHEAFQEWCELVKRRCIAAPAFILHADEHHDMLAEHHPVGSGNFLYFAMRRWRSCRVHWLVKEPIDRPDVWLSEQAWERVDGRFTMGPHIPKGWPKPDLVSVSVSPDFVSKGLRRRLVRKLSQPAHARGAAQARTGRGKGDRGKCTAYPRRRREERRPGASRR